MISRVLLAATLSAVAACASPPPPAAIRSTLPVPDDRILGSFAVSPNGEQLGYSAESVADGRRRLFIQSIASVGPPDREVPGTVGATTTVFLSGRIIHRDILRRERSGACAVSGGGAPTRVVDASVESAGATWTNEGRIVFAPLHTGLMAVSAAGGAPVAVTTVGGADGELEHGWPHALPDGSIVFTVSQRGRDPHLEVLSKEGKRTRLRVPIIGQAQFVETGHLVYSFLGQSHGREVQRG